MKKETKQKLKTVGIATAILLAIEIPLLQAREEVVIKVQYPPPRPLVAEMLKELELSSYIRENEIRLATITSLNAQIDALEEELAELKKIELSAVEFDLVCRVVAAESRGEPYEGQLAVAQVIRDRYLSGFYGNTIGDVLFMPNQFAEPWEGNLNDYPTITKAVEAVFKLGTEVFDGQAIYFFNPETSNQGAILNLRDGSDYFGTIGNHEFRGWQ